MSRLTSEELKAVAECVNNLNYQSDGWADGVTARVVNAVIEVDSGRRVLVESDEAGRVLQMIGLLRDRNDSA